MRTKIKTELKQTTTPMEKIIWTTIEKNNFRKSQKWIEFRKEFLKNKNYTCELCGVYRKNGKGLNVDHKYPQHYDDLNPLSFNCLCPTCHDFIEHLRICKNVPLDIKEALKKFFI